VIVLVEGGGEPLLAGAEALVAPRAALAEAPVAVVLVGRRVHGEVLAHHVAAADDVARLQHRVDVGAPLVAVGAGLGRVKSQESRVKSQESRVKSRDSRFKIHCLIELNSIGIMMNMIIFLRFGILPFCVECFVIFHLFNSVGHDNVYLLCQ